MGNASPTVLTPIGVAYRIAGPLIVEDSRDALRVQVRITDRMTLIG